MRIGIDATNVGGGGGITHLKEILLNLDFTQLPQESIIFVFSSLNILKKLPDFPGLEKISHRLLNSGLFNRLFFQLFVFDEIIYKNCDILLSITGDYFGKFKPVIGMSRNMLLYDRLAWKDMKSFSEKSRFYLNFLKQKRSFLNSTGIIFISNHAKLEINKVLSITHKKQIIINHGISSKFFDKPRIRSLNQYSKKNPFRFLYVSTVHTYKFHWNVVEAVSSLRKSGYPLELHLVGGIIFKPAGDMLLKSIQLGDPSSEFIFYHGHQAYDEIQKHYQKADGIIFASSCENMPNILIESMASGLPIACSNFQPMPEFLEDGGFYFDPKSIDSIVQAVKELLSSPQEALEKTKSNLERIKKYSWEKTSRETFQFIIDIANNYYVQK